MNRTIRLWGSPETYGIVKEETAKSEGKVSPYMGGVRKEAINLVYSQLKPCSKYTIEKEAGQLSY